MPATSALLWEIHPTPAMPDSPHVRCLACAHHCTIAPGARGRCAVRCNTDGRLYTLVGDGVASAAVDPVEKKPLYHYLPGTKSFSIGTEGCNFTCVFCQNAGISQHPRLSGAVRSESVTPDQIIRSTVDTGCASVAFTYNEPTVFIEQVLQTAMHARDAGLGTVLVSNGFQSPQALSLLGPVIEAANIDLKSMQPDFYRQHCGGALAPVLANLRQMRKLGWWLEVTTLIIPGLNDAPDNLRALAAFIATELGPDTPWHVSAFRPAFALPDHPPTPPATLDMARQFGQEAGLHFVYAGNVQPDRLKHTNDTLCPRCGGVCLARSGRPVAFDGICPSCATRLAGVWKRITPAKERS